MKDKLISILQEMNKVAFTTEEKADYLLQHDVVEVIRCDNCKRTFITAKGEIWCRKNRGWRKKIDYCSYGERKNNG